MAGVCVSLKAGVCRQGRGGRGEGRGARVCRQGPRTARGQGRGASRDDWWWWGEGRGQTRQRRAAGVWDVRDAGAMDGIWVARRRVTGGGAGGGAGGGQIGHDVKQGLGLLGRYLPGVEVAPLDDTMVMSFVLDAGGPPAESRQPPRAARPCMRGGRVGATCAGGRWR